MTLRLSRNRQRRRGVIVTRAAKPTVAMLSLVALIGLAGSPASAHPRATANVPAFLHCGNNIFPPSKSYNHFSPDIPYQVNNLMFLPLAFQAPHGLTSFIPQVATSWTSTKNSITVQLRRMSWQGGAPLTSTDVVDSFLLAGVDASGVWDAVSAVHATGKHTVVFTLAPNVGLAPAEALILPTAIVSAQQYGKFVTPALAKTVVKYEAEVRSDPTAAAASPLGHTMSTALTTLEKYNPPTLIGDGPFRLDSWTQDQALFSKSPTFFDASHVKVSKFIVQDTNASVDEGGVISGSCDQSMSGMPKTILEKDAQLPGHHVYYPLTYAQKSLQINDRRYPLNLTAVRQAIAYIIHRKAVIPLVYGNNMTYRFVVHPSLLYYGNELQYVTKSQLDSLNSYPYDPRKATQLLDSQGFKKVHGTWYLPDGKPFKLTITVVAVFPNDVLDFKTFATWLSDFGIKTTEVALAATEVTSSVENGNYDLAEFDYFGGIDPLQAMDDLLGSGHNFTSKTEPDLGFGPTEVVPGLGKVDVPATIQKDASALSYGTTMKRTVWDWARFINKELPAIPFGDRRFGVMFSTLHYKWPSKTSPLWTLTAFNNYAGLITMLERGYLTPRT